MVDCARAEYRRHAAHAEGRPVFTAASAGLLRALCDGQRAVV
jgi:hypothetical protein